MNMNTLNYIKQTDWSKLFLHYNVLNVLLETMLFSNSLASDRAISVSYNALIKNKERVQKN